MPIRFNLRRDVALNWIAENPILVLQEPSIELVDDGTVSLWGNLPFVQGGVSLDGGAASSTYTETQLMDGGRADGS